MSLQQEKFHRIKMSLSSCHLEGRATLKAGCENHRPVPDTNALFTELENMDTLTTPEKNATFYRTRKCGHSLGELGAWDEYLTHI